MLEKTSFMSIYHINTLIAGTNTQELIVYDIFLRLCEY
jgi:hypothetical protein